MEYLWIDRIRLSIIPGQSSIVRVVLSVSAIRIIIDLQNEFESFGSREQPSRPVRHRMGVITHQYSQCVL